MGAFSTPLLAPATRSELWRYMKGLLPLTLHALDPCRSRLAIMPSMAQAVFSGVEKPPLSVCLECR